MVFPSISDVAKAIKEHKSWLEKGDDVEIRLQLWESGSWSIHVGDPSYDQDHRGFWGSGFLCRQTNCRELAKELLEQAKEDAAMSASENS